MFVVYLQKYKIILKHCYKFKISAGTCISLSPNSILCVQVYPQHNKLSGHAALYI